MFDVTVMARCIRWPCRSCATAGRAGSDAAQRQNDIRSTILASSTGKETESRLFWLNQINDIPITILVGLKRVYIFFRIVCFLLDFFTIYHYMSITSISTTVSGLTLFLLLSVAPPMLHSNYFFSALIMGQNLKCFIVETFWGLM